MFKSFKDDVVGIKKKIHHVLYWILFDNKPKEKWPKWIDVEQKNWEQKHKHQIHFINHSTTLITLDNLNILTDPVFSHRVGPVKLPLISYKRVHNPVLNLDNLPKINYVLISHNHFDHLDKWSILKINKLHGPVFIVPEKLEKLLESWKINKEKVISLKRFESITFDKLKITGETSIHWSQRGVLDRNFSHWLSYVIEYEDKRVYFAGDTGYSDHFKKLGEKYNGFDLAILPIGAYLPRWMMKVQHINPDEAVKAMKELNAKKAFAIHFGTFRLAKDSHNEAVDDLKKVLINEKEEIKNNFHIPALQNGDFALQF